AERRRPAFPLVPLAQPFRERLLGPVEQFLVRRGREAGDEHQGQGEGGHCTSSMARIQALPCSGKSLAPSSSGWNRPAAHSVKRARALSTSSGPIPRE